MRCPQCTTAAPGARAGASAQGLALYIFYCPSCGFSWTASSSEIKADTLGLLREVELRRRLEDLACEGRVLAHAGKVLAAAGAIYVLWRAYLCFN